MEPLSYMILIPFISFVSYCILLMVILGSGKNKIARYYTFYIIAMIIWSFGSFVMKTGYPPSTLFWNRVLCTGLIIMPVIFYHFTLVLTQNNSQKKTLYIGYITTIMFLIANYTGQIIEDAYILNNEFHYDLGRLAAIMAIWNLGYLVLSLTNIIRQIKINKIPFVRVKYIIIGLIMVIIGGLLNLSSQIGKYPIDIIINTINAFFIAYSIFRYRFLEIRLIVKKSLSYSLYTISLTGIYIVAIIAVQNVLSYVIGSTTITSTLITAFILAVLLHPVRNLMQHWIDSVFYKKQKSNQILLRDFSKIINNIINLDELTDSLIDTINKGLQPNKITLILKQGKDEYHLYNQSTKIQLDNDIIYNSKHPIIKWFLEGKPTLTIDEIESLAYFSGLWRVEKKLLYDIEAKIIVPIKLRDDIIGLIILSEKKGGESYFQEEMDFLFTLANNVAIVIENAKIYEDLKYQANTDGLTKLYNHRYFHELLGGIISEEPDSIFSVAMIDVDFFKFYNDLYGHLSGDRVLKKLSEVIVSNTKKEDIIARYGGDEFAVILQGVTGNEALKVFEKIRRAIEGYFFSSEEGNVYLTVSIGVSNYPKHGKTSKEILDCADIAMYTAKRRGKNLSILYTEEDANNNYDKSDIEIQNRIRSAYFSAIYALAATIDAKDHYTYGHSETVSKYGVILAREAGFSQGKIDIVKNAGLLHDIGKVGVPEAILTKKDKLDDEEYNIMKKHVDISISIIKHVPGLINVIPAIMSHHERYDGNGYPKGIKGTNIPLEGRCLCIIDAYDAMTTDRPYRNALSKEQAIEELKKCSGTQFDPELTKIFIKLCEDGKINIA